MNFVKTNNIFILLRNRFYQILSDYKLLMKLIMIRYF